MTSNYLDIYIEQGEDYSQDINLKKLDNVPANISSYLITCQVRRSYWSNNVSTILNTSSNNTTITLSLDSANTSYLVSGRYVYDVFIDSVVPQKRTKLLEGILTVKPSSTRFYVNSTYVTDTPNYDFGEF